MLSIYHVAPSLPKPKLLLAWRENVETGAGRWEMNMTSLQGAGIVTSRRELEDKLEEE